MATAFDIGSVAIAQGEYYLVPLKEIFKLYREKGFEVDSEDGELPPYLTIDGQEYLFTERLVRRGEDLFEIVLQVKGFKGEEVETPDFFDDDDDYVDEN